MGCNFSWSTFMDMPLTLTDADASLLLSHLLRGNPDSALLPIIHDIQLSLAASHSATPFSTCSSGTLADDRTLGSGFNDFLGCVGIPDGSDVEGDYQSSEGLLPYCDDSEGWSENDFDVGPIDNSDYLSDGLSDYLSDAPTFENNFGVDPSLLLKEVIDAVDTSRNAVSLPQPSCPQKTHFLLIGYREMVIQTWVMMSPINRIYFQETA